MPKSAGKKANEVKKSRSKQPKPPVVERGPRLEVNTNPFFIKAMSNRIKVCQGCPVAMTDVNGLIPKAPFNYCIARKEKRPYKDKGTIKVPKDYSDAHYHLNFDCVKKSDRSFNRSFLEISDDIPTNIKDYITSL